MYEQDKELHTQIHYMEIDEELVVVIRLFSVSRALGFPNVETRLQDRIGTLSLVKMLVSPKEGAHTWTRKVGGFNGNGIFFSFLITTRTWCVLLCGGLCGESSPRLQLQK
jgi:hypothetical protein